MRKSFSARFAGLTTVILFFLSINPSTTLLSQCPVGTLSGSVFLDTNNNGVLDNGESAEAGLLVRAYDNQSIWVGQSVTDASGQYTISGLTDGDDYRLEFLVSSGLQVSSLGPDNGGDVQFVSSPNCSSNLGLGGLSGSCDGETEVFLACFVNGLGSNSPGQETILGIVNSFNSSSPTTVYATQEETGSIWGLAYRDGYNELYSSAFVKQHASLGQGGLGAIYRTDISESPSTSQFVNLSQLGQNVGRLTNTNSENCNYGFQVGTRGLGGMSIDDIGSHLYVANLFNNSIVSIDIQNPTAATTAAFPVPDPGCNSGDYRIFAVKYNAGSVYVGVTCTAETSQNEAHTSIHVYEMNISNGQFNLVFSDDFSRGFWSNQNISSLQTMQWLTDIDFASNGNMILALTDRLGHSFCNASTSRIDDQFGDILIANRVNGTWELESNGQVGGASGTGVGNGQGPNGGEFFGEDFFPGNPTDHPEVALGSVFVLPGSDDVIAAVFDPLFAAYSGGLHRYDTNSGQKVGSRELYNQNIAEYFGKATGFGDIHAACSASSPQIGNFVWIDTDCDGEQDAGEPAVPGLSVGLYDANCNRIGTTTTDQNGNYTFSNGIVSGFDYYISLDVPAFGGNSEVLEINNEGFTPTVSGVGNNMDSNLQFIQGCNELNGAPVVPVSVTGGTDLSFDIGLSLIHI